MTPDITVGLPVRNGAAGIARAITAISRQRYGNFVLVVSDNASSDETPGICERLAAADGRIRFIRQKHDVGPFANFRFVLEQAQTPFFMWAAHDDWLEPDVLESCRHALLERPDASVAVPETIIHEADGSTRPARGAAPMDGRTALRLARYLARPADNSRFYGMYRTDAVRRSFPQDLVEAPAADWVISALSLVQGVHVRARGGRLHRTGSPPERYARSARARAVSPVHRLLPTASATRDLLRRLPPILRLTSIPSLLVMASHQALWHGWLTLRAKRA